MEKMGEKAHVVMIPSTGMGHLIPMMQFANRMLSHRPIIITLVAISGQFPENSLAELAATGTVNLERLPPVSTDDCPPGSKIETLLSSIMKRSIESFRKLLSGLQGASAVVFDLFGTDLINVAKEFGISTFMFYPPSAAMLSAMMNLHNLDIDGKALPEMITGPGCPNFRVTDLPDATYDPEDHEGYRLFMHHIRNYREADGIINYSFDMLEPNAIMALRKGDGYKGDIPPVYFVGPLSKNSEAIPGGERHECLKWLDGQLDNSVLFVCFGSGGTMSEEQLGELATGLEMSGQRFLWIVRPPQKSKAGNYFGAKNASSGPREYLPCGFLERTENRGLVYDGWAPQADVLGHRAVGGFLSHCGWNSTLEAVVNGLVIIGWPLYAEQRINAKLLEEEIGMAVAIDYYEKEVVSRDVVEKKVRFLMEEVGGEKLKHRAKELEFAAAEAIQEGGSSWKNLAVVVEKFSSKYS